MLLGQRRANQNLAGYWELPGGKVEAGESPTNALKRELFEELGITLLGVPTLWKSIDYRYPHYFVRLHTYICRDWQGEPKGLEGQALHWHDLRSTPQVSPVLPATLFLFEQFVQTEIYLASQADISIKIDQPSS